MKHRNLIGLLLTGLLMLAGCDDDVRTEVQDNIDTAPAATGFSPVFDPGNGELPFPSDLLFAGSEDGTLNLPVAAPEDYRDPSVGLNTLAGFSTIAPVVVELTAPADPESLAAAVRVWRAEIEPQTKAVTGITEALQVGEDYTLSLDASGTRLRIVPLRAWPAPGGYVVALTSALTDTAGHAATPSLVYGIVKSPEPLINADGTSRYPALSDAEAAALEPVRQATQATEAAITAFSDAIARAAITLSFSFSAQAPGASLAAVSETMAAGEPPSLAMQASGQASPAGAAALYTGQLTVPYYLGRPTDTNPQAPLNTFWRTAAGGFVNRFNPLPVATSDQTIPVLATIPQGEPPATGWPVVMYLHGIMTNRTSLLGIADALAQAGLAAVAIDLPLHGVTGSEADPRQAALRMPGQERHFALDVIDNESGAPGPDGQIDPSGQHFINLQNLLVARDNLRQAAADLFVLQQALPQADLDGDGQGDFDTSQVSFLGHSLGAMVGTAFLATAADTPAITAAVLGMPGGGIAKLLDGSAQLGPRIAAGLTEQGLSRGTPAYERFLGAAQTIIEAADPLHYAHAAAAHPVLVFEIVGGNSSLPDQTIPNNLVDNVPAEVVPSPTAGTDPLIAAMGLAVATEARQAEALQVATRLTVGHHGSLLLPTPNPPGETNESQAQQAFAELQQQAAAFLASEGRQLRVGDPSLLTQ